MLAGCPCRGPSTPLCDELVSRVVALVIGVAPHAAEAVRLIDIRTAIAHIDDRPMQGVESHLATAQLRLPLALSAQGADVQFVQGLPHEAVRLASSRDEVSQAVCAYCQATPAPAKQHFTGTQHSNNYACPHCNSTQKAGSVRQAPHRGGDLAQVRPRDRERHHLVHYLLGGLHGKTAHVTDDGACVHMASTCQAPCSNALVLRLAISILFEWCTSTGRCSVVRPAP